MGRRHMPSPYPHDMNTSYVTHLGLVYTSQEVNTLDAYWDYVKEDFLLDQCISYNRVFVPEYHELNDEMYLRLVKSRSIKNRNPSEHLYVKNILIMVTNKVNDFMIKNYTYFDDLYSLIALSEEENITSYDFCLQFFNIMNSLIDKWFKDKPTNGRPTTSLDDLSSDYNWDIYKINSYKVTMNNFLMYPPKKNDRITQLGSIVGDLQILMLREYNLEIVTIYNYSGKQGNVYENRLDENLILYIGNGQKCYCCGLRLKDCCDDEDDPWVKNTGSPSCIHILLLYSYTSQEVNAIDAYWKYVQNDFYVIKQDNGTTISIKAENVIVEKYYTLVKSRALKYLFLISYYGLLISFKSPEESVRVQYILFNSTNKIKNFMYKYYTPIDDLNTPTSTLFSVDNTPEEFCLRFFNIMARIVKKWFSDGPNNNNTITALANLSSDYNWDLYKTVGNSEYMNNSLMYPPLKSHTTHDLFIVIEGLYLFLLPEYNIY
ncbi:uncharacterized protein LOC126895132 [Daktulosphaira vitifoliae]|uniref:uncharacterized protein LOC126895132 n=1 Tax=Daktulosphaira vitifoliae TaxID=58002 RepID=UPI0021AA5C32|nr:uncharacterized protein LOC126895132 [Daktulosphaira vitifoliae]